MLNQKVAADSFYRCRVTLFSVVALGVLGFSASSTIFAEGVAAGYTQTIRGQEQAVPVTNGVFYTGAARTRLTVDTPLTENTRLTIEARFTRNGWLQMLTGRGNECLSVLSTLGETPTLDCRYIDPSGVSVRKFLRVGGQNNPNFSWTESLLNWNDHYRGLNAMRMPDQRWMRFTLELRGGRCRFLLNGNLLHEWTPTEDLYGRLPVIVLDSGTEVRLPEVRRLTPADPLYLPIDISARYNATGLAGAALDSDSLPARGTEFAVGGVPFVLGEAAATGLDNLDVGLSWFREGNLVSCDEEPHKGTFGGRWKGSVNDDPTRFQFPVPQRSFTALHLLAVSEAKPNAIPRLTAQFFRPSAGFPKSFVSTEVPTATNVVTSATSLQVKTVSGETLHLWHVSIPIEPGLLQEFEDLDVIEVELTKDVQIYRSYPDPDQYSAHAGGLPSAVRVFAMTMGVAPVAIRFEPEALGNVWVEAAPAYWVTAQNNTDAPKEVQLDLMTVSHDGSETNQTTRMLTLLPTSKRAVRFDLSLQRYGHHNVTLLATCDGTVQTHARTLSRLRRREYAARPFDAKGFMFGYWNWRGGQAVNRPASVTRCCRRASTAPRHRPVGR